MSDLESDIPTYGVGGLLYTRRVMLAATMCAEDAPGRTFAYWLSQACLHARSQAGLRQKDIPANQPRVSRFESKGKWPVDPEELVQAYAQALRIKDSRQLWEYALELWIEHGKPPKRLDPQPIVPGIQESELLQRLRATMPNGQDRERHMSRPAAKKRATG